TVLGVPCLTLRPNTERPVTITHGTNQLVTEADLLQAVTKALHGHSRERAVQTVPPLWDGRSGERIAAGLTQWRERGPCPPATSLRGASTEHTLSSTPIRGGRP